jgi:hypothetical protein
MTPELGPNRRGLEQEPPAPLAAISILSWDCWQDGLECLPFVRKPDYPNSLIVLVDTLKVLLYDPERFSKLSFSFNGLVRGLRGRFGPMPFRSACDNRQDWKW